MKNKGSLKKFADAYNNSKRCFINYCARHEITLDDAEWMLAMANKKGYIIRKYYRL